MGLKITHTNRKNTSFPIQMLLDPDGNDAFNVSLSPNSHVYAREEFITSSLRVALQRDFVTVLHGITIPDHLEYHVVYGPDNLEPPSHKAESFVQTDFTVPSEEEHKPLLQGEQDSEPPKPAAEMVKEYAEEEQELKTGTWDDEEIKYLKRVYPVKGAKYVAEKLNRAEKSVYKKAESLAIKKKKS